MGLFDKLFGRSKEDEFAVQITKRLKAVNPDCTVRYDRENFRLVISEEGEERGYTNLGNAFAEYTSLDAEDREQHLSNVVRSICAYQKSEPDDIDDARHDLLPSLRNRSYFELTRLHTRLEQGQELDWPYQEISDHLGLSVVYDLPEATCAIQQHTLDKWDITFYEALEIARDNLEQREAMVGKIGDGLYVSATNDSYDASRIILFDRIRNLEVQGDHITMIPTRDNVLITGSEDSDGLKMMVELATKLYQEEHHPMTLHAFRLRNEDWTPWLPDPEHELFPVFHEASTRSFGSDYEEQKEILDQLHEKELVDEFVASFSGLERDGRLISYCVWSSGIVSLLPKTDLIMFFQADGNNEPLGHAPWDRVAAVAGDLLIEVDDLYPTRYRVVEFPTREQLAQIGLE